MTPFKLFLKAFSPCLFLLMGWLLPFSSALGQALPCPYNITTGSVTLASGAYTGCSLTVSAGATLVINGAVTLNLTGNVDIEGEVYGLGLGYGSAGSPTSGPGAGVNGVEQSGNYLGGSGAGHGGTGGGGNYWPTGGTVYDSSTNPVLMGSAGGSG